MLLSSEVCREGYNSTIRFVSTDIVHIMSRTYPFLRPVIKDRLLSTNSLPWDVISSDPQVNRLAWFIVRNMGKTQWNKSPIIRSLDASSIKRHPQIGYSFDLARGRIHGFSRHSLASSVEAKIPAWSIVWIIAWMLFRNVFDLDVDFKTS